MNHMKTVASYGRIPGTQTTPYYIEARHAWLQRGGIYVPHFNKGVALKGKDVFIQRHQEMMWLMDEWRVSGDVKWYEHVYHGDGLVSTNRISPEPAEEFLIKCDVDAYDRDVAFGRREPAF